MPVPVVASPKVHEYVALASAVDALASKVQLSPVHVNVKLATGGCGPFMKPVNNNLFTVPTGSPVMTLFVALDVSAVVTCAGVADGLACK